MSLKKHLTVGALLLGGLQLNFADTLQLKDKSAVTGKILAEKSDSVVVDLGYTVLVVPRNAISRISRANETNTVAVPTVATAGQFYSATTRTSAARDVSSLVKQIGEAVV